MAYELSVNTGVGGCCAMGVVYGFLYNDPECTPKQVAKSLKEMSKSLSTHLKWLEGQGKSIAFATLCNDQSVSESVLLEAGFTPAQPDWAYRNPDKSNYKTSVKVYTKLLYTPPKEEGSEEKL